MKTRRIFVVTILAVTAGAVMLLVSSVFFKDLLIETWQLPKLESSDPTTRLAAMATLGRVGSTRSVERLFQSLGAEKREKDAAQSALRSIVVRRNRRVTIAVLNATRASEPPARALACRLLVDVGMPAVPTLIASLRDEDTHVRWVAADALGRIGKLADRAIPALEKLAREDPYARDVAAWAVRRIRQTE